MPIQKEAISTDMVKAVAKNARLDLTEKEINKFQKDLNDILIAFKELDRIKADCEPSFQPVEMRDVVRKDIKEECLTHEKALSNTKHRENGFFKGPRAV